MNNPMTWLAVAAIAVQGVFALALLLFWRQLGAWTLSNRHLVELLVRTTHSTPESLKPLSDTERHPFYAKVKEKS